MGNREQANILYLVVTTALAIPYAFLPVLAGIDWSGSLVFNIQWIIMLAIWFLPLVYIAVLWTRWRSLVSLDYLMFVAPVAAWLLISEALKWAIWEMTDGHAVFGSYGRDKGMSNALAESILVLAIAGLYLLSFPRNAAGRRDLRRSRRFLLASSSLAVAVALIVPPLPD